MIIHNNTNKKYLFLILSLSPLSRSCLWFSLGVRLTIGGFYPHTTPNPTVCDRTSHPSRLARSTAHSQKSGIAKLLSLGASFIWLTCWLAITLPRCFGKFRQGGEMLSPSRKAGPGEIFHQPKGQGDWLPFDVIEGYLFNRAGKIVRRLGSAVFSTHALA